MNMLFQPSRPDEVKVVSVKNNPVPFPWRRVIFILGEMLLGIFVAYAAYINTGTLMGYGIVAGAAVLLLAWWSIGALLFSFWGIVARAVIVAGFFSLGFWQKLPMLEYFLLWFIFMVVLCAGALHAKSHADNSIQFSALGSFSGSRGAALFCLSLVVTLCMGAAFLSYGNASFSRSMIDWMLMPAEKILQTVYPGFSFDMTANDLFTIIVKKQTEQAASSASGLLPSGFSIEALSQGLGTYAGQLFQGLEREARMEFMKKLSAMTGLKVTGTEKISDLFYSYTEKLYQGYSANTRNIIGKAIFLILLVGTMGIVNMVGFVFSFIELSVFGILRGVRLITIGRITVEKEVLSL